MILTKLRRFFLWYGLMTKRLLKKPSYLILLLAVPVLTAAMTLSAQRDTGLLNIALAGGDGDPVAAAAKEQLRNTRGLLRCLSFDSPEEAIEAVKTAQVDAAWIFRDDAGQQLQKQVTASGSRGAVMVVEREETVFLRLAREELAAVLYPTASRFLFREHLASLSGDKPLPDDSVLEPYYRTLSEGQQVLVFTYDDGQVQEPPRDFLTNPLRGLLSLVVVLAGLVVVSLILVKTGFYTNFAAMPDAEVSMKEIGMALVGSEKYQYVLPFEFISVFLLACIIGGLVVARKEESK